MNTVVRRDMAGVGGGEGPERSKAAVSPRAVCGDNRANPRRRAMQAFVYRSGRKPDTYLYLRGKDAFAVVPDSVRLPLGALELVLEFTLTPERKLARADAAVVRANLQKLGYHLQAPPTVLDPLVAGGVGDG
ncbi:MAG: YcgL domain-containing protein [Arenimonas sp.]